MRERQELLRLTDNSVDFDDLNVSKPSFAFERDCFCWYAQKYPELLAIGPRVTEDLLSRCDLGSFCKPDGIFFEIKEEDWILRKMIEIKSGNLHGMSRKVDGFKQVTHTLRTSNGKLTRTMKNMFEEMDFETPRLVIVPPDQNIEVVFVSHRYHQPGDVPTGNNFRLTFLRY